MTDSADQGRFWIFQSNPKVWDLRSDLTNRKVGDIGDWSVSKFADQMGVGDQVALWTAGSDAGVYALGELTSVPYERPTEGYTATKAGTELAVDFRHTKILEKPILRRDLLEHPTLRELNVVRAPQGTNFSVSDAEWAALMDIIDSGVRPRATWWVNQGSTFAEERAGGYIWAPKVTKAGHPVQHHTNVALVSVGDVVISYADGEIRALCSVTSPAEDAQRPSEFTGEAWDSDGRLATMDYFDLSRPIRLEEIAADHRIPENGPFTAGGGVKQGYLFEVDEGAAMDLRKEFQDRWPAGSPWASRGADMHLLFKWNAEREAHTVDRHAEVAKAKGSVWWGKFGSGDRASLSAKNINKLRDQIARGDRTLAILYRPGEAWTSTLLEITDDPDEVDEDRLPSYYTKDECELFVRIEELERVDADWPLNNLVLASNPDPEKMRGALGNQRTPLMVNLASPFAEPPSSERLDLDWLVAETGWEPERLRELIDTLANVRPQVVLAGPPGTGKTWVAQRVARYLAQNPTVQTVQFHPSYGYEEFIEGLRPEVDDAGLLSFEVKPGIVRQMVEQIEDPDQLHVLVIDEMNRANLPRVFGELMYLFEYRDDPINLQYTNDFELPQNLLFIGTMNTADRSIRSIDIALRRRFDVFECPPDPRILRKYYEDGAVNRVPSLLEGFESLNEALTADLDRHHTIGHTFFMAPEMSASRLRQVWDRQLRPLIEEYFFDQHDLAAEYTLERFWSLG